MKMLSERKVILFFGAVLSMDDFFERTTYVRNAICIVRLR